MIVKETPSGIKCVVLNNDPENFGNSERKEYLTRCAIARTPKGGKQNEYIKNLLDSGYVINPDSAKDRKSLDTVIERAQFKLTQYNKYWNSNFEILYGKLSGEKFGYYMYNKEVM